MTWKNRVVWTEGMFLRTQHFQQADRYAEYLASSAMAASGAYYWGVDKLEIDEHLLKEGRIGLTGVRGKMRDGAPFDAPIRDDAPAPLVVPKDMRDTVVHLCTPIERTGAVDTETGSDERTRRRYGVEIEVSDSTREGASVASVSVSKLSLRLMPEGDGLKGYETIPICKVVERKADDTVVLAPSFIPTVTSCVTAPALSAILSELRGLLHQRGEAIASRLGSASAGGVAEVTDFLLLQAVNRNDGVFRHLASMAELHPERLYTEMVGLACELSTFTAANNRPPKFESYHHGTLQQSFEPVLDSLRSSLSAVFEQTAIAIPLEDRGYGVRVGKIADKSLFDDSAFVIAAQAAVDEEELRGSLPKRTTIGAVERIRDLVNMQLGGAPIRPLAAEPRQIRYRAGAVYFSIQASHEEWRAVQSSGGVAIHVSGELPDLDVALWAIRGRTT
ncbi:MAG: type VI secretion system baseplate subunit TssK [Pseudomonadota bacterium]